MTSLSFELTGVWISNLPFDQNEGAKGSTLLRVLFHGTEAELAEYEFVDESGDATYRELCVPAELLSTRATIELVEDEDARSSVRFPDWSFAR